MAWLNVTPKPPKGVKIPDDAPPRVSRVAQMKADGIVPKMPPNPAPHFIDRLVEIGLTESTGMGAAPLSWASIAGWQSVMGITLQPWEAGLIRKLSVEYLAESHRAEEPGCPAPWQTERSQREIEVEDDRLRSVLG